MRQNLALGVKTENRKQKVAAFIYTHRYDLSIWPLFCTKLSIQFSNSNNISWYLKYELISYSIGSEN